MVPPSRNGHEKSQNPLLAAERTSPFHMMLRPAGTPLPSRHLTEAELLAAEIWFEERVHDGAPPRLRHPRMRMWFIFMLLRHAGLRLVEIFRLREESLDFGRALVRVPASSGAGAREVPLPPAVARKLATLWSAWEGRKLPEPFLCDASRVRRNLRQCALVCGLPTELFTARELRRNRGLELERAGVHTALVDMFLGRDAAERKSLVRIEPDAAKWMLRERIQVHARSSARNHFRGRVIRVRYKGLLADVTYATASGLEVHARITSRSCRSMGLTPGTIVRGSVKALWIEARPASGESGINGGFNRFFGTVDDVRREDGYAETLVTLEDGALACTVRPASELEWLSGPGQKVEISFSPASIILDLG